MEHLTGGLVGESEKKDGLGRDTPFQEVSDPIGDHPRLAASRTRDDQNGTIGRSHHFQLFLIEIVLIVEERLPRSCVAMKRIFLHEGKVCDM